jgi:hypothetical protein
MDKEKLMDLKELLDELIGENEPSDEDLDFDDDAIECMLQCIIFEKPWKNVVSK